MKGKIKKQSGYMILMLLTIIMGLAAVFTALPREAATKISRLGYRAMCSYTPYSTILCLLAAGFFCKIRSKRFTSES